MKTTLALVAVLLSLTRLSLHGEEAKPVAPEWYKARPDETFVGEVVLKAGESKSLKIKATKPTTIGFKTNLKFEQGKDLANDAVTVLVDKDSMASPFGGATEFTPRDGGFDVKVENKTKIEVRVVIYTKEKKPAVPPAK
jgi:hypothetical protein